jgi:hypothetical protein
LRIRAHAEALAIDFSTKDSRSRVDDYRSTYVAQLQAMHNITPGQAEAVAKQYTSWRRLYEAYEALPTERQRQNMLVGLEMGRKKSGGETDRKLGKGLSSRWAQRTTTWRLSDDFHRIHRQLFERDADARMDINSQDFGN